MAKANIQVGTLFSWSRNFDVDKGENVLSLYYYPNDSTMLKVEPSAESIDKLKAIRDEFKAICSRIEEFEGTVLERWEKQTVTKEAEQVEEWVQVS